jgi:uncharacterized cupin superfamily protein
MPSVSLHDHPVVEGSFGRMQALNGPLGVTAFGVNGVVLDPDDGRDHLHDETDEPQQEVYVVVAGRATFRVGGETIDAPAGTIVSVPDPAVERGYTAAEPGTRIVCIGAAPDPSPPPYGDWIGND